MQVDELISALVKHSGMSYYGVSAALDKSPEYARNVAARGRAPKIGTVADVADIAECDLVIVDRKTGERLATVEPPRRIAAG